MEPVFLNIKRNHPFFTKLKSLLNPDGQILIDSSDIIYMFDNDEDGGKWIPSNGLWRIDFTIRYKMKKRRRISLVLPIITRYKMRLSPMD
jgi:hypothetical protein